MCASLTIASNSATLSVLDKDGFVLTLFEYLGNLYLYSIYMCICHQITFAFVNIKKKCYDIKHAVVFYLFFINALLIF